MNLAAVKMNAVGVDVTSQLRLLNVIKKNFVSITIQRKRNTQIHVIGGR